MSEPHAVVKLLVARMESHPEEFERGMHRWSNTISYIIEWGNETDKAAMNAKLRDIRLREAHEDMLEELLNGPENRRKQQEEAEYERQMLLKQAMTHQRNTMPTSAQTAAQQYASQYGNAFPWIEEADTYNTNRSSITNTTGAKGLLTDTVTQIGQMIRNKK